MNTNSTKPKKNLFLMSLAACLLSTAQANATWSIVAVDEDTGEVGVALASCAILSFLQPRVPAVVPGIGAVTAQAVPGVEGRLEAERILAEGGTPQEVLAVITDPDFEGPIVSARQYGIVALGETPANYTGDLVTITSPYSGLLIGSPGHNVAVQGNTLVDARVLDDTLDTFERTAGQPLAARLVMALQAGSRAGGDSRCNKAQTALAAILWVAQPGDDADDPSIRFEIGTPAQGPNPVVELRRQFVQAYGPLTYPPLTYPPLACAAGTNSGSNVGVTAMLVWLSMLGIASRRRRSSRAADAA